MCKEKKEHIIKNWMYVVEQNAHYYFKKHGRSGRWNISTGTVLAHS